MGTVTQKEDRTTASSECSALYTEHREHLHGEAYVCDPIAFSHVGMMIIINCNGGKIASQFVNFVVFVAEISTRRSCSISVRFRDKNRRKIVWCSVTTDDMR